jgi:hypothetical protein
MAVEFFHGGGRTPEDAMDLPAALFIPGERQIQRFDPAGPDRIIAAGDIRNARRPVTNLRKESSDHAVPLVLPAHDAERKDTQMTNNFIKSVMVFPVFQIVILNVSLSWVLCKQRKYSL